jgi:hypothetical protein
MIPLRPALLAVGLLVAAAGSATADEPDPIRPVSAMTAVLGKRAALRASPPAMDTVHTPPAYLEPDEFQAWEDRDAAALAQVVTHIGRIESR